MIEETAHIVRVRGDYAWVETEPATACGSCAAGKGCGISVLASLFGRRNTQVKVKNGIGAAAGDRVVIGISEAGLVQGSLAVYVVPLAALFAGMLAGGRIGGLFSTGYAELASILGAAAGLLAGLVWLRRYTRAAAGSKRYQPEVLRHQLM